MPRKPKINNIETFEGKSIFYSIKDKSLFANKKIVITGGGDSAVDWVNELYKISSVTLVHRRKEFRAASDSVQKMYKLLEENKIAFHLGQLSSLNGKNGILESINIINEEKETTIETNYLISFFGLKMELGPIINWNLKLEDNRIVVDTEKFETSVKKIFSIGDINIYPGKLKLILSGFHEGALMARKCEEYCFPDKKRVFRYTTASKEIHKKLGVK